MRRPLLKKPVPLPSNDAWTLWNVTTHHADTPSHANDAAASTTMMNENIETEAVATTTTTSSSSCKPTTMMTMSASGYVSVCGLDEDENEDGIVTADDVTKEPQPIITEEAEHEGSATALALPLAPPPPPPLPSSHRTPTTCTATTTVPNNRNSNSSSITSTATIRKRPWMTTHAAAWTTTTSTTTTPPTVLPLGNSNRNQHHHHHPPTPSPPPSTNHMEHWTIYGIFHTWLHFLPSVYDHSSNRVGTTTTTTSTSGSNCCCCGGCCSADDWMAGILVGMMIVPQSMSYAKLAGLSIEYGLYSSFVPLYTYAVSGWSRWSCNGTNNHHHHNVSSHSNSILAIGPVALISLLLSSGLTPILQSQGITPSSSSTEYVERYHQLAIQCSMMVGCIYILLGLLRYRGRNVGDYIFMQFVSPTVLSGFTSGAAIIIATSQLKYLLGYNHTTSTTTTASATNTVSSTSSSDTIQGIIMALIHNAHQFHVPSSCHHQQQQQQQQQ
jgi:hypothetical protein